MFKFGIDATYMSGNLRGMGRYALQMTTSLKKRIIFFQPSYQEALSKEAICKGVGFFPIWEQWILPKLCKQEQVDVLICPYNTAPIFLRKQTKLIVVLHDLIFLKKLKDLPLSHSWYQNFGRFYRSLVLPRVINRADVIVTVSHFTKQEIISKFLIEQEKLFVIPNSIDHAWLSLSPIPLHQRKNYFLSVAGDAPSKNVARLIKAFGVFKKNSNASTLMKIVGIKKESRAPYLRIAAECSVHEDLIFFDYLSSEELQNLYLHAKGFIFASTFEGFGIPLLEAMSCYVPVACSNTTSMPEILGGNGVLFDPYSIDSISEALGNLADESLWTDLRMIEAKNYVASNFSFDYVSDHFNKILEKLR